MTNPTQPNLTIINHCGRQLINSGLTIALAESATAGRICAELALADNAGKFLKGGLSCYDATLKENLLNVPHHLIENCTPESAEVTQAIADGLADLIKADIHIGCTGLTCPGGSETEEKPVGTIFLHANRDRKTIFAERTVFQGTQTAIVVQTVDRIVSLILTYLCKLQEDAKNTAKQSENNAPSENVFIDGAGSHSVSWP